MLNYIMENGFDLIILILLQYDIVSILLMKKFGKKIKNSNISQTWISNIITLIAVFVAMFIDHFILENIFFHVNIFIMGILCFLLFLMNYLIIFRFKSKIVENEKAKMIRDVISFDYTLFNYIAGIKSKKVILVLFFIVMIIYWGKQCS